MEKKKTLHIYRQRKHQIKEETYYNGKDWEIWFKARSNCLELGDRSREEEIGCKICGYDKEDIHHFMLHCEKLRHIRLESIYLQKPHAIDENVIIGDFLFEEEDKDHKRETLYRMWRKRATLIKELSRTIGSA